jgi:hypothetical protein
VNPAHDIALDLDAAEFAFVASIYPFLPASVIDAKTTGFDGAMIEDPALRLLWSAAEVGGDLTTALGLGKRGLMAAGYWNDSADPVNVGVGGWCDESLVNYAFAFHGTTPPTRELARFIVRARDVLEDPDAAPMYQAPPQLGQINPLRLGLALAQLSRWTGIPAPWVHDQFARTCARQDRHKPRSEAA